MTEPAGFHQRLVWRDGKLCWRIRQIHHEYIRKPWYKGGGLVDINVTYGEPRYIEIEEDNTNG